MTSKEKKGILAIVSVFIFLAIVLVFTMEKSDTSNTFEDNPLVNKMPNRLNP